MNCTICRAEYMPKHKTQATCLDAICKAESKKQQARAREERKAIRVRKEKLKTRSDYIKEADAAFSAYIRYRDKDKSCICCGLPLASSGNVPSIGGDYDCGHYISRRHLATRWNEENAAGQRKYCNRYQSGNQSGFRHGLIMRNGIVSVVAVEALAKKSVAVSAQDLKEIAIHYKLKLKALKNQERLKGLAF
jgi:hypothetical protein